MEVHRIIEEEMTGRDLDPDDVENTFKWQGKSDLQEPRSGTGLGHLCFLRLHVTFKVPPRLLLPRGFNLSS